jgi:hypothetical protein
LYSDEDWADLKSHYPIGAVVKAKVVNAFPSNRTSWVTDGRLTSLVEWSSMTSLPGEGVQRDYRVMKHLDATQRILLAPA